MLADSIVTIEFKYQFSGSEECWDDGYMSVSNIDGTNNISVIGKMSDDGEDFEPKLIKITDDKGHILYSGEFSESLGAIGDLANAGSDHEDGESVDDEDLSFVDILGRIYKLSYSEDSLFEMADIIDNMLYMMDSNHVVSWVESEKLYSIGDDTINLDYKSRTASKNDVNFYVARTCLNGAVCDITNESSFEKTKEAVLSEADWDKYLSRSVAILGLRVDHN